MCVCVEGLFITFAYKSKRIREHVRLLHDNLLHRVQRGNFHEHITVPTCQVWTANILHEYHSSLNVSKAILHKCKLKGNRNVAGIVMESVLSLSHIPAQ